MEFIIIGIILVAIFRSEHSASNNTGGSYYNFNHSDESIKSDFDTFDTYDSETSYPASSSTLHDDWITDPVYSYIPGNIYHQWGTSVTGMGSSTSFLSSGCDLGSSDWITDPCCFYMLGNIFHDSFGTDDINSGFDDSFSSFDSFSSTSIFDD
ncbi:MAG: hypothetical protein RBQ99_04655 [Trichlorobacter sp.]|nr:hypothetical protein [Trichlorobacter sp.]